jgi:hypothetical protein
MKSARPIAKPNGRFRSEELWRPLVLAFHFPQVRVSSTASDVRKSLQGKSFSLSSLLWDTDHFLDCYAMLCYASYCLD